MEIKPLDSADALLGVTEGKNGFAWGDRTARCHSDWSDERSEERNEGISGEHHPVHPA